MSTARSRGVQDSARRLRRNLASLISAGPHGNISEPVFAKPPADVAKIRLERLQTYSEKGGKGTMTTPFSSLLSRRNTGHVDAPVVDEPEYPQKRSMGFLAELLPRTIRCHSAR